jgi:hypothetical protein
MRNLKSILGILLLLAVSLNLKAQNEAVQLCGKLEIVDSKLAKKLDFFKNYEDFQQAMVFSNGDNAYIVEVIYKTDDKFYVDRKALTQAELDALCKNIDETGVNIVDSSIDQKGRQELLVSSTISGLGFYAWMTPLALNVENARSQVGVYMLVGGSSFFVPFFLTKDKEVTQGMARAYSIGTGTGVGHGFLIKNLVDNNYESTDWDARDRRFLIPMAFGLTESIGMMKLAEKYDLSVPNVSMIASGSVWGAGYGLTLGALTVNDDTEYPKGENRTSIMGLLGSGAGMYAGHKIYQKMPPMTNGDVLVMNAYGVMGATYAGMAADLAFDDFDSKEVKIMLSGMTAVSAAGLAYGLHRTKDYNYSTSEGAFIGLSEIAGGLLGIGVAYLISNEGLESETALVSASLGGSAGLFFMDNFLRNRNLNVNTSIGNVDFGFNPAGVANAFDKSEKTLEDYQRNTNNSHILSAKITF